jgi:hypothetical protein
MNIAIVLAIVWILSNFFCFHIARKRNIKRGFLVDFFGIMLGPFAIPLVYIFGKPVQK